MNANIQGKGSNRKEIAACGLCPSFPCCSSPAASSSAAAGAQTPDQKPAPKPPDSPSKVLLDSWNDIGRKLIAMAEDMPEDKYDFKPNPAQRSFAEQLLHASGANYFFINPVKGT